MQMNRIQKGALFAYSSDTRVCPMENLKKNAFYLQPLKNPTSQCWYSVKPIGHDTLDKAVARMCSLGGVGGYRTIRATAATRLYQAGVDEQLIMEKTGHRSTEGARSYKHTSEQQLQQLSDILHGSSSTANHTASLIQPLQQPLSDKQESSTEISVHHSSASKNVTMNFTQTPSFNIQG